MSKRIDFTYLDHAGDPYSVSAIQVGRFAVYAEERGRWVIAHIGTGRAIFNRRAFSQRNAIPLAQQLEPLLSDEDIQFLINSADGFRGSLKMLDAAIKARTEAIYQRINQTNWRALALPKRWS